MGYGIIGPEGGHNHPCRTVSGLCGEVHGGSLSGDHSLGTRRGVDCLAVGRFGLGAICS